MENKDDQKIIKYINGHLSDAERKAFKKEMANNHELSEEVDFYKSINTVTNHVAETDLKSKINKVVGELDGEEFFNKNENQQPQKLVQENKDNIRRLNFIRPALAIAASLLILIVAGFWYANSNYSNTALVNKYFNADATLSTVRSETGITNKYEEGLLRIENKEYDKAISFFNMFLIGGNFNDIEKYEPAYYLSLTYFQKGDFIKAADASLPLATNESRWQPKGRWLQLHSLLSIGQTDQRFYDLLEVAKSDSTDPFYQKQAKTLSEELDNFWRKVAGD